MDNEQVAKQLTAYRALLPRVRGRLARIALLILIDEVLAIRSAGASGAQPRRNGLQPGAVLDPQL